MIFALLTFLAAFSVEAIGTIVSVIGLSSLFGANLIIIALAISLDVGKVVTVSLLYKHWTRLSLLMKTYGLLAAIVTMIITSAGAAGYLTAQFQTAVAGVQEGALKVQVLKEQITKYEERKKQIDASIAAIPDRYTANQKIKLMSQYKQEQQDLQAKIGEIDKQLPQLQISQIGASAKAGPILTIAKSFNVPIETAVLYVILLIIFVFDPLAVFLIVAGNFLWEQRSTRKKEAVLDEKVSKFDSVKHAGEEPVWHDVGEVPRQIQEPVRIEPIQLPRAKPQWVTRMRRRRVQPAPQPEPFEKLVDEIENQFADTEPSGDVSNEENLQGSEHAAGAASDDSDSAAVAAERSDAPAVVEELKPEREEITLSSLGVVKPDAQTVVRDPGEVGYRTGAFKT